MESLNEQLKGFKSPKVNSIDPGEFKIDNKQQADLAAKLDEQSIANQEKLAKVYNSLTQISTQLDDIKNEVANKSKFQSIKEAVQFAVSTVGSLIGLS